MLKQEYLASGQQPEDWKDLFDSSDPDEAFMVVIRTTAPGGYIINPQNLEGPDGRLNTFGIVSLAIDSDMDTVLLAPGTYSLTAYGPDKSKKIFTSDAIGWNQLLYQRANVLFTVNNGIQVTEQNVEAWHYDYFNEYGEPYLKYRVADIESQENIFQLTPVAEPFSYEAKVTHKIDAGEFSTLPTYKGKVVTIKQEVVLHPDLFAYNTRAQNPSYPINKWDDLFYSSSSDSYLFYTYVRGGPSFVDGDNPVNSDGSLRTSSYVYRDLQGRYDGRLHRGEH